MCSGTRIRHTVRNLAFTILVALFVSAAAQATGYPVHPVTLVVPFTPGGPSEVLARIIGKQLEHVLGQPFVIENRPGGASTVAAEYAAHAKSDICYSGQRQ